MTEALDRIFEIQQLIRPNLGDRAEDLSQRDVTVGEFIRRDTEQTPGTARFEGDTEHGVLLGRFDKLIAVMRASDEQALPLTFELTGLRMVAAQVSIGEVEENLDRAGGEDALEGMGWLIALVGPKCLDRIRKLWRRWERQVSHGCIFAETLSGVKHDRSAKMGFQPATFQKIPTMPATTIFRP